MPINKVEKIWMSGKWVAWDDAKIHILSHVAHYASSVFEGIRAYATKTGVAIFRLDEHIDRLMGSAKIYRMELPFTREQIRQASIDVVSVNDLKDCYIRPLVYRGYENLGVNPFGSPVEVAVAAFPWGQYLGPDALAKLVRRLGVPKVFTSRTRRDPVVTGRIASCSRWGRSASWRRHRGRHGSPATGSRTISGTRSRSPG